MVLTPFRAALLYLGVAVIFTWPLAAGLTRDIPLDLGDSLLNAWILAWDADHLRRFLAGDLNALRGFWSANIFHPEPLTLAYSEHLIAQAVQILPVYVLTGNIILCYNLLFFSTFVLSGLGVFLYVREITGSTRAAFVAGLIYAFAPYRVPQFSHLQVVSSQWMPFVLYGLRRYFVTRSIAPLAGAGAALVAQNLSNGYFLLFFAPFVLAYALFEMASRGLMKDARAWAALSATAVLVTAATVPFLLPYLELRALGIGRRTLDEVRAFSADTFSYWTAPAESHLWGGVLRADPKPERDLFPTFTALGLALVAVGVSVRAAWRRTAALASSRNVRFVGFALLAVSAIYAVFLLMILSGNGFTRVGPVQASVTNFWHTLRIFAIGAALLLVVSRRARGLVRHTLGDPAVFMLMAAVLAGVLSFGPEIRAGGRLIGAPGPYYFLFQHVPGFDGLRVPARYAMVVLLFMSIAAGVGAAAIERRFRRGGVVLLALGAFAVAEGLASPIAVNGTAAEGGYAPPSNRVYTRDDTPAVYQFLRTLPAGETVLVEFPFGEWAYELRYVFYSINHWHPLLNGYSGHFPLSYNQRAAYLRHPLDLPDFAWDELLKSGVTHAVVHGEYYKTDEGERIASWLRSRGASQIAEFDGARVFALR